MKVEMNPYLKLMREKMVEFVGEYEEVKGMVFIQTRATAFALAQYLSQELASLGIRAAPFTGTNSSETSKGMEMREREEREREWILKFFCKYYFHTYTYIPSPVDSRSKYMKGLFSFENSAGSGAGLVIGGGISTAVPRDSSLSLSATWGQ